MLISIAASARALLAPTRPRVVAGAVRRCSLSRRLRTLSLAASSRGELERLTVPVLKDKLRDQGLKVGGKKAELVERLLEGAPRPASVEGAPAAPAPPASDDWFAPAHRAACPFVEPSAWPRLEAAARALYDWNAKINVVSRKGLDPLTLIERHYLPSLALLAAPPLAQLPPGSHVVDVGTGGGFPGLPLAICRPDLRFDLVDSTKKTIDVVKACAEVAQCQNVDGIHGRAPADLKTKRYDLVLGRSVKNLPDFFEAIAPLVSKNGSLLYIKGGDLEDGVGPPLSAWAVADLLEGAVSTDKVALHFAGAELRRRR